MTSETGTIEIRQVRGEERIATGFPVASYAFGASPQAPNLDDVRKDEPYREKMSTLVAFIDSEPQATLASHEMTQNVRGAVLPMGGIAGVASMPSGRRRGVVRAMFERQLALYHEAGVPISLLYPFRDSFYERLGYVSLPMPRHLTINPEALAPLVRLDKPGRCEQVEMKAGFDAWRAFLERYQRHTHGFALKHITNARRWQDANEWWVAFARDEAGEIAGAMTYKITGYTGKLIAGTFLATSPLGRYQLLDWVGRHADQVKEAVIEVQPDDYPETWFRDLQATVRTDVEDAWPGPMARVVAVPGLAGIGCGEGTVTVEIHDGLCPWNDGTFTLRGEGGTLSVTPGGAATSRITIQGLAALVYGGADPDELPYRGWGDPDAATADALRALFPPVVPEVFEKF
jgi:predicted acetyltransferase